MRQTIIAAVLVLCSASAACAEWGLYVSRNGQPWRLEQTFAFKETVSNSCERTAGEMWRAQGRGKGNVTGVTCQEYIATWTTPQPQPQQPQQAEQGSTGRGRKEAGVEYAERVLRSAEESARHSTGRPVYSDGSSYAGKAIQDAAAGLSRAQGVK